MKILFLFAAIAILFSGGCGRFNQDEFNLEEILKFRPSGEKYLFDYGDILEDVNEYTNQYLKGIRERYSIEVMIVSVPSLEGENTVEELAVKLLNNWGVGRGYGGRAVLLLFANKEKQVKLEVSYELEDVFTDAFCGYIEELQLKPYFLSGRIGTGLLAVMEEIENRAQIKHQGDYTSSYITQLDGDLLSGGAGAKKDLLKFEKEEVKDIGSKYPAGKTPDEAWQTLIQSWREKVRDPNLGIYTEITKLYFKDYQNLPDSNYDKNVRNYADKPYQVIKNENYAVIFFGNKNGWDNAPFLFCRTQEGWKYDVAHMRKYIRMGQSPYWGMERANYPYAGLLSCCPYWMGQDIPLEGEDVYRIEKDEALAKEIKRAGKAYRDNPDDFNAAMKLGRLYTIASMGPKTIPILKKAKQLNLKSPFPFKYLAIEHVDAFYQYNQAINELKEYVKREPRDVFGHNFLGYLYYCTEDYPGAIEELKRAVQLRPDNCYAYCKLSRSYGELYLKASPLDFRRDKYKELAVEMLEKAQRVSNPGLQRIGWLKYWLRKKNLVAY
ncbi:MAG: TPM domain-containing protein [Candidatus Omnitrophota bacterium]|nr:TPM domain-containing protein [Candidatus Omnitrophota bacterium]